MQITAYDYDGTFEGRLTISSYGFETRGLEFRYRKKVFCVGQWGRPGAFQGQ